MLFDYTDVESTFRHLISGNLFLQQVDYAVLFYLPDEEQWEIFCDVSVTKTLFCRLRAPSYE